MSQSLLFWNTSASSLKMMLLHSRKIVSILVVLEYLCKAYVSESQSSMAIGLNPCCSGIPLQEEIIIWAHHPKPGLNPCCSGIPLQVLEYNSVMGTLKVSILVVLEYLCKCILLCYRSEWHPESQSLLFWNTSASSATDSVALDNLRSQSLLFWNTSARAKFLQCADNQA